MTSLLTEFNQSLCNSLTAQPKSSAKELIAQQQQPTSLLAKRSELNDLDDLLVKKHKTQSTQASETNSDDQSVSSRDNFGSNDFAILACSETFDEEDSSSILGTPIRQSFETINESSNLLQQALKALELRIKMFEEQNKKKEANIAEHKAAYAIPVFQETAQFALREATKTVKSDSKAMEEEIQVTYGSIEFPFLSFSATLNDLASIRNGTYKFPGMEEEKKELPKEKKETKIFKIEKVDRLKKKVIEIKKKVSEKSQKEKITKEKVESKKKIETEVLEAISRKLEQKRKSKLKSLESKKSSKIEIEEPKAQSKSHISPFAFARRKFQRKKNKWQVEQDEKLGSLQIQRQVSCEAYSFMFEGSKKKAGLIPIGSEYQVDVCAFTVPRKSENKRAPKAKWSPAEHDEIELNKFLETVEGLSDSIINEESAINLVMKNNNDLKKAMKYIKSNKSKVLKTLVFKPSN